MFSGQRQADAARPVVPGVARETPPRRRHTGELSVLAVIALGGIVGAEARYAVSLWLPHRPDQLPVGTWLVNVSGCFFIGVLMVVITELTAPHRLVRPFLGVGVLGGYTTFSTATVEVQQLALHGRAAPALGYLLGTVVGALVAVALGTATARAVGAAWARRAGASRS
jgi:CrcB protein